MLSHIQHQWIKANLSLSADGHFFLSLSFTFFPPITTMNNSIEFVVMEADMRQRQMSIKARKMAVVALFSTHLRDERLFSARAPERSRRFMKAAANMAG